MDTKLLVGGGVLLAIAGAIWLVATREAAPQPPQPDIRLGFIRSVDAVERTLEFDAARWLSGKEAEDAAITAGICTDATRDECIPNDYFISNDSTSTEILSFGAEPLIAMMTLNAEQEGIQETHISFEEFSKLLNDSTLLWSRLPYQLLLEGGEIKIVEEVYVP